MGPSPTLMPLQNCINRTVPPTIRSTTLCRLDAPARAHNGPAEQRTSDVEIRLLHTQQTARCWQQGGRTRGQRSGWSVGVI